jgi:hypothetical protein
MLPHYDAIASCDPHTNFPFLCVESFGEIYKKKPIKPAETEIFISSPSMQLTPVCVRATSRIFFFFFFLVYIGNFLLLLPIKRVERFGFFFSVEEKVVKRNENKPHFLTFFFFVGFYFIFISLPFRQSPGVGLFERDAVVSGVVGGTAPAGRIGHEPAEKTGQIAVNLTDFGWDWGDDDDDSHGPSRVCCCHRGGRDGHSGGSQSGRRIGSED